MAELKANRLSKIASEFNVGITTIVEYLKKKGHEIDANPNTKIAPDLYALLSKEYSSDISAKKDAERVNLRSFREKKETIEISEVQPPHREKEEEEEYDKPQIMIKDTNLGIKTPLFSNTRDLEFKVVGKIDLEAAKKKQQPTKSKVKPTKKAVEQQHKKDKPPKPIVEQVVKKPQQQQHTL